MHDTSLMNRGGECNRLVDRQVIGRISPSHLLLAHHINRCVGFPSLYFPLFHPFHRRVVSNESSIQFERTNVGRTVDEGKVSVMSPCVSKKLQRKRQINQDGVRPGAKKVEAIKALTAPTTRKQLRSFVGMVNFYRDTWKSRSHLLAPLMHNRQLSRVVPSVGRTSED